MPFTRTSPELVFLTLTLLVTALILAVLSNRIPLFSPLLLNIALPLLTSILASSSGSNGEVKPFE